MGLFNLDTIKESTISTLHNDTYELIDLMEGYDTTDYLEVVSSNTYNLSLLESYIDYEIIQEGAFMDKAKNIIEKVKNFMKNLFNKIKDFILKLFNDTEGKIIAIVNEFDKLYEHMKHNGIDPYNNNIKCEYKIIDYTKLKKMNRVINVRNSGILGRNTVDKLISINTIIKEISINDPQAVENFNHRYEDFKEEISNIISQEKSLATPINIKELFFDDNKRIILNDLNNTNTVLFNISGYIKSSKSKKFLDKELAHIDKELNDMSNNISKLDRPLEVDNSYHKGDVREEMLRDISKALSAVSKLTSINAKEWSKMINTRLQDLLKLANYNLKCLKNIESKIGGES